MGLEFTNRQNLDDTTNLRQILERNLEPRRRIRELSDTELRGSIVNRIQARLGACAVLMSGSLIASAATRETTPDYIGQSVLATSFSLAAIATAVTIVMVFQERSDIRAIDAGKSRLVRRAEGIAPNHR